MRRGWRGGEKPLRHGDSQMDVHAVDRHLKGFLLAAAFQDDRIALSLGDGDQLVQIAQFGAGADEWAGSLDRLPEQFHGVEQQFGRLCRLRRLGRRNGAEQRACGVDIAIGKGRQEHPGAACRVDRW